MQFGFLPREGGESFDGVLEEVRAGEAVGFDQCWCSEHHQSQENYWPAPFVRLASMAAVTSDVDFVTSILVSTLRNAVELAEKAAVFDRVSDGRFVFGTAIGYVPEEFEAYGVPLEDRAGRYVEGLRLFDAYLRADGPVDFEGEHWSLADWHPVPTSLQDPRPALWVGGWGELSLARSLRLGDAWLPGVTADLDGLLARRDTLEELADEHGVALSGRRQPLMRDAVIAETQREAERLGRRYLHRAYIEEYGSEDWDHPFITHEEAENFESLAEDRFLVGTPDRVIEQIQRFQHAFGMTDLGVRFHFPGMDHETVLEQIELFGHDVIPSFQ